MKTNTAAPRRVFNVIKPPKIFDCFICQKHRNCDLMQVDEKRWAHFTCMGPYIVKLETACKESGRLDVVKIAS